jgi:GAF domain-containing protein
MSDDQLLETARRLAERLSPADLDATLSQVTAAAVELLPDVQFASITIRYEDGSLKTVAPTGEVPVLFDAQQYRVQQGPYFRAATDTMRVIASDLGIDERWPSLAGFASTHGVRALMALRLYDAQRSSGALNLYSTRVGAFENAGEVGALFAHQAGLAVANAEQITNLAEAVKTRTVIGQAVNRHGALRHERRACLRLPPTGLIPRQRQTAPRGQRIGGIQPRRQDCVRGVLTRRRFSGPVQPVPR